MSSPAGGPVLVGVDGGRTAADALGLAAWAAGTLDVPLIVAAVHPAPSAIGSGRVDAEWIADRRGAAERALDDARTLLSTAGTPGPSAAGAGSPGPGVAPAGPEPEREPGPGPEQVRAEPERDPGPAADLVRAEFRVVASSSAAHGLHDLAEQTGASLIVVGSGASAPNARILPGSTAERLLAGSVCPVAVAPAGSPPPAGTPGRIGVAYVDTPDGRAALHTAARLARRTAAPLLLITVVARGDAARPFLLGSDAERAFLETARESYEEALRRAAATITDVPVTWEIRSGDVVEALSGLTEVDVLFCGSRGYGPARRVLLGGVSARLLRRACRPVVVVPRA